MKATLTPAEIARIEALLSRLDPDPAPVCRVPGCRHSHGAPAAREGVALAA